jgi:hypothetical protein
MYRLTRAVCMDSGGSRDCELGFVGHDDPVMAVKRNYIAMANLEPFDLPSLIEWIWL